MPFDISALLVCPACKTPFPAFQEWPGDGLRCTTCSEIYPMVGGIPRFVRSEEYVGSFGYEWTTHRRTQLDHGSSDESESTFRTKTGFAPEDVRGKLVLDVGCGMGRFADVVSRWGGKVVAIDLSRAVEAANENIGARENVCVLQADVFRLPFREEVFDVIYSIGVLHHTPDCERAFRSLPRFLKPGGKMAIWVYSTKDTWGRIGNFYRAIAQKLPNRLLHLLCYAAVPLYYVYKIPLIGYYIWKVFPTSTHPMAQWRVLDTFDWYSPRYQSKHTYQEVHQWFESEGLGEVRHLDFPVAVSGIKASEKRA